MFRSLSLLPCLRSLVVLLAFLLCCKGAAAQQVLDLGKVDVVAIKKGKGSLLFYQKQGRQYKEVIVRFGVTRADTPIVRIDSVAKNDAAIMDSNTLLLPVKHLRSYSSKAFYAYLSNNQFGAKKELLDGDTVFTSLQPFTPFVMLVKETTKWIAKQEENGTVKEWDTKDRYFSEGFCLLRLAKDKYLTVFDNDGGYIIPCRDGDYIFADGFFPGDKAAHAPADKSWQQDVERLSIVFKSTDASIRSFCNVLDTGDDEHFRLAGGFALPLLPGVYDEIELSPAFIFARKGKAVEIYNYFLQLLVSDARSYSVDGALAQVLTGNKLITIDMLGIAGPNKKYLPDIAPYYSSPDEYYRLDNKDSDNHYMLYSERRLDRTYRLIRQNNPVIADKDLAVDEMTPLWINDRQHRPEHLNVAIRSKGLYGLFAIPYPKWSEPEKESQKPPRNTVFAGDTLKLTALLPIVFDSIVPLKYNEYLKICRKGLVGLYPLQHEARYSTMELKFGFLRFTLPGGRKGWMNLKTLDDFMDE